MDAKLAEHLEVGCTVGLPQCGGYKKGNEENKLFFYEKEGLKTRHGSNFL